MKYPRLHDGAMWDIADLGSILRLTPWTTARLMEQLGVRIYQPSGPRGKRYVLLDELRIGWPEGWSSMERRIREFEEERSVKLRSMKTGS